MDLPEDLIIEVLVRVADPAALFRFDTACKRWQALVADRSFLRRRQRELITALGVYEAEFALSKVMRKKSEVKKSRMLLTMKMAQCEPIHRLFQELSQDGNHGVMNSLAVSILNPEARVEKLPVLSACRISGPWWREFVEQSGIYMGDRVDIYVCRRGAGERGLLFFN